MRESAVIRAWARETFSYVRLLRAILEDAAFDALTEQTDKDRVTALRERLAGVAQGLDHQVGDMAQYASSIEDSVNRVESIISKIGAMH